MTCKLESYFMATKLIQGSMLGKISLSSLLSPVIDSNYQFSQKYIGRRVGACKEISHHLQANVTQLQRK